MRGAHFSASRFRPHNQWLISDAEHPSRSATASCPSSSTHPRNSSIARYYRRYLTNSIPPVVARAPGLSHPCNMSSRKREISAEERAVCARLKALWEARASPLGLTQESAAAALGISQGAVSHYLNARNAIGFEAMFRWAQMLRIHPYDIDPRFASKLPDDLRRAVESMSIIDDVPYALTLRTVAALPSYIHEKKPDDTHS